MSIIVYWMEPHFGSRHRPFEMNEMSEALVFMNERRAIDLRHVSMSVENPDMVGSKGVDTVADGKTPDGQDYEWSKAGRAGRTKRGSELIPARNGKDL